MLLFASHLRYGILATHNASFRFLLFSASKNASFRFLLLSATKIASICFLLALFSLVLKMLLFASS